MRFVNCWARRLAVGLAITATVLAVKPAHAQKAVTFKAADGTQVFGDYYAAADKARPIILLFHQAGSNRFEYAPIAPRLVAAGFNCLAIDQRAGGTMWGHNNETVEKLGHSADYIAALPDLEAALAWARSSGHTGKVLVWGSSYSAALVFVLAARHSGEIDGVLAFSPGEYLGTTRVDAAAAKIAVPIFVTSAKDEEEIAAARKILAASPAAVKMQLVPKISGVHGSSTLRSDRNAAGAEENWEGVLSFLKKNS